MTPSAPNRLDNLVTLRNANLDMAFATAFVSLSTGVFMVGFVQLLGGSDLWIGVLSAIPALAGIFQIPGAIWGRGFPFYKRFVTPGGLAWRLLQIPIAFLPLLIWPNDLRLAIAASLLLLASICVNLVNPIYNDWLAEMIPANSRGWFFSRRNAIGATVGAVAGIIGAAMLDGFRAQGQAPIGFTVVFSFGLLMGLVSFVFYNRMGDIPRAQPVEQNLREGIRSIGKPFGDRAFRRVLLFLVLAIVGQTFPGNLYAAFARETLDLNFTIIQATGVFMAIGNVAAAPLWGFLSDKFGNKPILGIGAVLLATNPIPWMVCQPGQDTFNAIVLLSTHIVMGVIWASVTLTQFNMVLATAPAEDRANYLGAGLTTIAVVGGIAPLMGAATMASLREVMTPEMAYKWIFGITVGLRLLAAAALIPVREPGAKGFRATLRELRHVTPTRMRTVRRLAGGGDAEARQAALRDAGQRSIGLAADDILRALNDPLPRVRRQAATALAQVRDPRTEDALLAHLADHPDLIEEEFVDTLGQIGDERSIPALVGLLDSPRSLLRRAAARGIARVGIRNPAGAQSALPALLRTAAKPDDPDLRRAALQALRILGDPSASAAVGPALLDPHPSVRIAAAEAASELQLTQLAETIRESMTRYQDEASAEVAYALGAVGGLDDLPTLVHEAARTNSGISRRRILLGIARILGCERETYRLLLAEGIQRDQLLMARKSDPTLADAVRRYSVGDEHGAIERLSREDARLLPLLATSVPEAFLVAFASRNP